MAQAYHKLSPELFQLSASRSDQMSIAAGTRETTSDAAHGP